MYGMAGGTFPTADSQIFHKWIFISTTWACLTAWIHGRHFDDFIPVPGSFIFKHGKKLAQDTLEIDLASLWLRSIPFICRSSMQIVWFSRTSMVDCFCRKSFRWLVIFSWTRATCIRCLLRLLDPFCFRESFRCSRISFLADFSRYFGLETVLPLLSE